MDYLLRWILLILVSEVAQCYIQVLPGSSFEQLKGKAKMWFGPAMPPMIPPFCYPMKPGQAPAQPAPVPPPPVPPAPAPVPAPPAPVPAPPAPVPGPAPAPAPAPAPPAGMPMYPKTPWWCPPMFQKAPVQIPMGPGVQYPYQQPQYQPMPQYQPQPQPQPQPYAPQYQPQPQVYQPQPQVYQPQPQHYQPHVPQQPQVGAGVVGSSFYGMPGEDSEPDVRGPLLDQFQATFT
uniref:Uncharacterized protein n=1 Tax=Setaria digitata TaxID=48799 RepID=A0A915PMH5_9BILA